MLKTACHQLLAALDLRLTGNISLSHSGIRLGLDERCVPATATCATCCRVKGGHERSHTSLAVWAPASLNLPLVPGFLNLHTLSPLWQQPVLEWG